MYIDANFNNSVWRRYNHLCNEMTILLRREEKIYSQEEAEQKFNPFDRSLATPIAVPDVYVPRKNLLNMRLRKLIASTIDEQVRSADRVVIRSFGNIYIDIALRCVKKYKKTYSMEVADFAFESFWYHSLSGKLLAFPREWQYKRAMKEVDYALYVTSEALQKRYPCRGKSISCSNVELPELSDDILNKRLKRIDQLGETFTLGTAAFLDVGWKGQRYAIEALYELKKQGINNFRYELIGSGDGNKLKKLIHKYELENRVKIVGSLPHDKVFDWLDTVDIYIQPSFQEGLCRSIIEAMGRACTVVCTDIGGNYELVDKEYLFPTGDAKSIANLLLKISTKDTLRTEARTSFINAKKYQKSILDQRRNDFYKDFVGL